MNINLGKNIKFLRNKKNIDQQELADKLKVPRSTLACWENGIRTPNLEQVVKIAEFFDTNLDIIYKNYSENNNLLTFNLADSKYIQLLKKKGLMDENGYISDENLIKLEKIVDVLIGFNKNENDKLKSQKDNKE